ncbi:hypothetical protein LB941_02545 [Ligilactobacillus sp. WILCCON 0076]|uniref:Uncharacterized protein n=1 Tax=Ligilactobacillus ubinensis TaxID=2876789 RepID=A0A9X2JL51_9LACO|nr:hypothetical protein [Ligilactobacillus ubinensis]MCP0886215.1 hypothetical protein [Ligilactobacillus ubinensis]
MKDTELIAEIMKKIRRFDGSADSAVKIITYLEPIFLQFNGRPQGISEGTLQDIQRVYEKFIHILAEEKKQLATKISGLSDTKQKRIVDAYAKHMQSSMKRIF